jgi:hypothetical protein
MIMECTAINPTKGSGTLGPARRLIQHWKRVLELDEYEISCERISLFQVSDSFCRVGISFVGVEAHHEKKWAKIYCTRSLKEEDIIHELLHVRHPSWTESQVIQATMMLLSNRHAYRQISECMKTA